MGKPGLEPGPMWPEAPSHRVTLGRCHQTQTEQKSEPCAQGLRFKEFPPVLCLDAGYETRKVEGGL